MRHICSIYVIYLYSRVFNFYLFSFWLFWVCIATHGLSLVTASRGYSLAAVCGFSWRWLLLWSTGSRTQRLSSCSSQALEHSLNTVAAHGLSYSEACGIILDRGSNRRPLHCKAGAYPLDHQGSPAGFNK